MRWICKLVIVAMLGFPGVVSAQEGDETLADIRQELAVLYVELQRLKRELSTTGASGQLTVGGTVIDRVNAMEAELQRLTSKAEQLEFRIDRVVTDGTNRVGDLEFRICELEPGCDVGSLEVGETLGGIAPSTGSTATGTDSAATDITTGAISGNSDTGATSGVELAVGEQADFDTAMASFEAGNMAEAAQQFALFQQNYPGSPLGGEAGLKRGEALEQSGEMTQAARAYLDTFSAEPNGPKAPDALFHLGRALAQLGQTNEACVTLSEVGVRFPQSPAAAQAQAEIQNMSCG